MLSFTDMPIQTALGQFMYCNICANLQTPHGFVQDIKMRKEGSQEGRLHIKSQASSAEWMSWQHPDTMIRTIYNERFFFHTVECCLERTQEDPHLHEGILHIGGVQQLRCSADAIAAAVCVRANRWLRVLLQADTPEQEALQHRGTTYR
jgi:hypothetical protein